MSDINNNHNARCAPTKTFSDGSCIPLRLLVEMAKCYNNETTNINKIKLNSNRETLSPQKYKKYLVGEFEKRLGTICDDQKCWVKQDFMKQMNSSIREELTKNTFRFKGPQGNATWLDTNNINNALMQYEYKYHDFKFLGAVPIDFDDLPSYNIKNLNYKKLMDNGMTKLGIVFNLDEHDKPGSHWTAMFADLLKGNVFYFDSYGIEPEQRIINLMKRTGKFIQNTFKKRPKIDYNKTRHQFGNSACGVYSISFITRMLRDGDFNKVTREVVKDDEINKCRKIYFTK